MRKMVRIRTKSTGHELALSLRNAYLTMHRQTDACFAEAGVTADQFVLLCALADEKEALTQQELADRITSDRNTLRAMLLLLEEKKLLRRDPHPTDKRARLVRLTPDGEQVQQVLWTQSETFRKHLASLLSPEDTEDLLALLRRFAWALMPQEDAP